MVYKLPKEAIGDNELDAGNLDANLVNSFVPVGGIIMWSGTIAEAEALTNWAICDGQNGTPDLRDKFVLGVGSSTPGHTSTASVDDTGGSNSITLTEGQMPSHNHNITDNGHSHGNGTLAVTGGDHNHSYRRLVELTDNDDNGVPVGNTGSAGPSHENATTGDSGNLTLSLTGSIGSNTTGITAQLQGNGDSIDIRSAYLALCYIIRVT